LPVLLLGVAISMLMAATTYGAPAAGRVRVSGEVAVKGVEGMRYRLRTGYAVPRSWRRVGRREALKHRFGPIGSCRIRVTISASVIAAAQEDAVARATRLLPGTGRKVLDYGTRTNGAYRVVRAPTGRGVNALLVKPAPNVLRRPTPYIVWIELRARAVIDPRTECHSGGPRTVGVQLGDAFAAIRLSGFQTAPGRGVISWVISGGPPGELHTNPLSSSTARAARYPGAPVTAPPG
jgi:hypothetical protein